MKIESSDLIEMAQICAELARQSVTFRAYPDSTIKGAWIIELTGGY